MATEDPSFVFPGQPGTYLGWANSPQTPNSLRMLQTRDAIARAKLGQREMPYPKNFGEGLTYATKQWADAIELNRLAQQDAAYEAALRGESAATPIPGTGSMPPVVMPTGAAPPGRRSDVPSPYRTASLNPEDTGSSFRAASEPTRMPQPETSADAGDAETPTTGPVPLPPTRPVYDRNDLRAQMEADPATKQRLLQMIRGEGGNPQFQAETVFNRATTQGIPLAQALETYTGRGSRGYYPAESFQRGQAPESVLTNVLRGASPTTEAFGAPMTGNASGPFASRRAAAGIYNKYARDPATGETYVQQDTPAMLARLEASRFPGRRDAIAAAATPSTQVASLSAGGTATDAGGGGGGGGILPEQLPPNPPIVRPDLGPAPERTAQASPQMGSVPGPLAPPVPQPPAPPGPGVAQPLQSVQKPVPPILDQRPTPEEIRGITIINQHPGDPNYKALGDQYIAYGRQKREAEFAQKQEGYKADLAAWQKDFELRQAASLRATDPAEAFKLQEARDEAARKQTQYERWGGLSLDQMLHPIKESLTASKNLAAAQTGIGNAKQALLQNPRMFTGPTAEIESSLAGLANAAGFPLDPRLPPTQAFKAYLSSVIGAMRPQVVGAGSQSDKELATLQQAVGSDIKMSRPAIEKILNSIEILNTEAAREHQKKVLTLTGADENLQRAVFPTYGVPNMERVIPSPAVDVLKKHFQEDPQAAVQEFDEHYNTPGLALRILKSGR